MPTDSKLLVSKVLANLHALSIKHRLRNGGGGRGPWSPRFCNFSIGIRFLPYKTTLLSSVVPINQITIGNSRLLGNFLAIGISRFYDCTIGLLKLDNLITLYLKLNQIFVINSLILTESYIFVHFIVYL